MSKVGEIASKLSSSYKNVTCTLKSASEDDTNRVHMVDFLYDVLDYDGIAKSHKLKKAYPYILSSNDAVYISNDGVPYFIEFKNGSVEKLDIQKKGIGSAILAMDLGIVDSLKELQAKAVYILVYNADVIENKQSKSQKNISNKIRRKAGRKEIRLKELDGVTWLYHATYSYRVSEFEEKFINAIVKPEYSAISS